MREKRLKELAEIIGRVRPLLGQDYIPMCDIRRYNQLMKELFEDELGEDPEIEEAKG